MKIIIIVFFTLVLISEISFAIDFYVGVDGFIYLKTDHQSCKISERNTDNRGILDNFNVEDILDSHFLVDESDKYSKYINEFSQKYKIDPYIIKALINVESNFNEKAYSSKGAIGLMQLMPDKAPNNNRLILYNPKINIEIGTKYFAYLLKKFHKNYKLALSAYNAGPTIVAKLNAIPPFAETKNFVKKNLWFYNYYKNMSSKYQKIKKLMKFSYNEFLKKNYHKSIQSLTEALGIMPENGYIYFNLGLAYSKLKIDFIAVDYFKKAVSYNPYIKEAYYNLAIIYTNYQDVSTASLYYKKYKKLCGNDNSKQAININSLENNFNN